MPAVQSKCMSGYPPPLRRSERRTYVETPRRYNGPPFVSTGPQQAGLLRPDLWEFDFKPNLTTMFDNRWHDLAGIAKVEAPQDWSPRPSNLVGDYEELMQQVINSDSIFVQQFTEHPDFKGIFKRKILDHRALTVAEFMDMAMSPQYNYTFDGTPIENERKLFAELEQRRPVYVSDLHTSIFEKDTARFNLKEMFQEGLLKTHIDGITSPFCYLGMAGTVFCAHREDVDLVSVNYHHYGAPKYWIALTAANAEKLEKVMKEAYPEDYQSCAEFLRHKHYIPSTDFLREHDIPFCTEIQRPGEIIITFPKAYHFGFNMGLNIAEAVNFGCKEWVPYGAKAGVCVCGKEGYPIRVAIHMARLMKKHATLEEYLEYIDNCKAANKRGIRKLTAQEMSILDEAYEGPLTAVVGKAKAVRKSKKALAIEPKASEEQVEGQKIEEAVDNTTEKTSQVEKPKKKRKSKKACKDEGNNEDDSSKPKKKKKVEKKKITDECMEGDNEQDDNCKPKKKKKKADKKTTDKCMEGDSNQGSMECSAPEMEAKATMNDETEGPPKRRRVYRYVMVVNVGTQWESEDERESKSQSTSDASTEAIAREDLLVENKEKATNNEELKEEESADIGEIEVVEAQEGEQNNSGLVSYDDSDNEEIDVETTEKTTVQPIARGDSDGKEWDSGLSEPGSDSMEISSNGANSPNVSH